MSWLNLNILKYILNTSTNELEDFFKSEENHSPTVIKTNEVQQKMLISQDLPLIVKSEYNPEFVAKILNDPKISDRFFYKTIQMLIDHAEWSDLGIYPRHIRYTDSFLKKESNKFDITISADLGIRIVDNENVLTHQESLSALTKSFKKQNKDQSNIIISQVTNTIGMNLFRMQKQMSNESLVLAPLTVVDLLSIGSYFLDSQQREKLSSQLGFKNLDQPFLKTVEFINSIKKSNDNSRSPGLILFNRLIASNQNVLLPVELKNVQDTVKVEIIEGADFVYKSNKWIGDKTHQLITEIADLSIQTLLASVMYFKLEWTNPFEVKNTSVESFFFSKDYSINVNMMHKTFKPYECSYYSCPSQQFEALWLPYNLSDSGLKKAGQLIILPAEGESLSQIQQSINPIEIFNRTHALNYTKVNVSLPKTKSRNQNNNLYKVLENLGVDCLPLKNHYASIKTDVIAINNEEGTEAAAVCLGATRSIQSNCESEFDFKVNRPFMSCVIENSNEDQPALLLIQDFTDEAPFI